MAMIPKKYGELEPIRINPDSSAGIYVTASVEAECCMISQNRNMREENKKIASKLNT